ncbi:sulfite exporter TauE/SafE family protein [Frigidibacter sp. MR17.24]|uniref:sulfite exporter TauE/SafE family protein n=1 Tax=Frigidibacter sp. MR17.24 TaxID=3127345 RepID=UPI003012DAA9
MDLVTGGLSPAAFCLALVITLFGGVMKGLVGFALPLIMVAGFAGFMPHKLVVVAVLLPILVTNAQQALRDGPGPFRAAVTQTRRLLAGMVLLLLVSTQLVQLVPERAALLILGLPIAAYAGLQLAGVPMAMRLEHRNRAQWISGSVAGLYGGIAGVWGPPIVVYLLSAGVEKREALRTQGMLFLLGGAVALAGHWMAGAVTPAALLFSAVLVVPAVLGTVIGDRLLSRVDQAMFRRFSQLLLVVVGLNLIRQALS